MRLPLVMSFPKEQRPEQERIQIAIEPLLDAVETCVVSAAPTRFTSDTEGWAQCTLPPAGSRCITAACASLTGREKEMTWRWMNKSEMTAWKRTRARRAKASAG